MSVSTPALKKSSRRVDMEAAVDQMTRPAVIYTRVSDTNEDNNDFSHEYQERACRAKAESLGYTVLEVFSDNFTGRYLYERPGLSRLRHLVLAGGVQAVFVWKLDRFSRKLAQRAIVFAEVRDQGCQILSATEEISDSPEGRLLEAILGAIAEFEVERTLERSQGSLSLLRDRGSIICQGLARYGYRYVVATRTREIVEEEAKWVKKMFEWYLAGDSGDAIAARLTALGVATPAVSRGVKEAEGEDRRWHGSVVRGMLHDSSYAGDPMTSGKKRSTDRIDARGHTVTEKTPESDWWVSASPTPPIVSRVDFDRVQALMKTRTTFIKTRNGVKPYLLRGMVRCAVCGLSMSPQTVHNGQGKAYHYFACISAQMKRRCGNSGTPIAWLDAVTWNEVVRFMSDSGAIERRFAQLAKETRVDDITRDLAAHNDAIATSRASVKRLVGRLAETDDAELIKPIEERLVELKATIAAHQSEATLLGSRLRVWENQSAAINRAKEAVVRGLERLRDGVSFEEKRDLLEALDLQVIARKKELKIRMGLPLVDSADHPGMGGRINEQRLVFEFTVAAHRPTTR